MFSNMKNMLLLVFVFVFEEFQSMEKSEFKSVWKKKQKLLQSKTISSTKYDQLLRNPDEGLMNLLKKISGQHRRGQ